MAEDQLDQFPPGLINQLVFSPPPKRRSLHQNKGVRGKRMPGRIRSKKTENVNKSASLNRSQRSVFF